MRPCNPNRALFDALHQGARDKVYQAFFTPDITEELLDILLEDKTRLWHHKAQGNADISTSVSCPPQAHTQIIWGCDSYAYLGDAYAPDAPMHLAQLLHEGSPLVIPRAKKTREAQKERTRTKAEVFTPVLAIKTQNDALDPVDAKLEAYLAHRWLEITCGEAPYITTRYQMHTGDPLALSEREGVLDRKFGRLNAADIAPDAYCDLMQLALASVYGFEYSGDSLFLARVNVLLCCLEAHQARFGVYPDASFVRELAHIISYNFFQMDGCTLTVPFAQVQAPPVGQVDLFDPPVVSIPMAARIKTHHTQDAPFEPFNA